ncbi:unnamed protein product [Echinostoma caproni]|uniref:Alpha-1,3-glucosyltransferase n=1 Tax=Echinostoma caproni TaxID=27848 RepID=A0A183BC18_9TREM|nr:unnamed protein product [Echinostoma caproni]
MHIIRDYLLIIVSAVALKLLRSTDFEVHRNWKALTYSLPISKWYLESTSQWTLDYPPLFAWFELVLAQFGRYVDPKLCVISKEPYASSQTVAYLRSTVILSEMLLFYGLWRYGQLHQIWSRLFPFGRGLCHAYWAPNAWALYNAVDKLLIVLNSQYQFAPGISSQIASMTGGLVGEINHPTLIHCAHKNHGTERDTVHHNYINLLIGLTGTAWSSFLFGWHVHEKAVLIILLPLKYVLFQHSSTTIRTS